MDRKELSKLPIALREDVAFLFSKMRKLVSENSDLLRITYDKDYKLEIEHIDIDTEYKFTIENPKFSNENKRVVTIFSVKHNPKNSIDTSSATLNVPFYRDKKPIEIRFNNWLTLVKKFNTINEHPTNDILNTYKERVYNAFVFLDDENDDEPLKDEKRKQFSKILTITVEALKKEENPDDEIIRQLIELNKQLPQLTQRQIKETFSLICAKMIYKGIDAFNHIIKTARDAGIGQLFLQMFN